MPLPAALAARLAKRGLVSAVPEEEVIAESYDDESRNKADLKRFCGATGCPNKWNPYHLCLEYCFDHWGDGLPEERLPRDYIRQRTRMLKKYSLPPGWVEVYDAGIGRHYYWSPDSDEVCWISPKHPRAVIGEAAPKIAKLAFDKLSSKSGEKMAREELIRNTSAPADRKSEKKAERFERKGKRNRGESPPSHSSEESEGDEDVKAPLKRAKFNRKKDKNLDPMDPAAYSNISKGKWASGLERGDEAKTGVDSTASGPLFQMRPYPAPGAILRKQQDMDKKKKKK